jgi:hypothetical protein
MVRLLGELHHALLATLHNPTELRTLCNIQQQSMKRLQVFTGQDTALEKLLGEPLPAAAHPWTDYRGEPRLVNLTARTAAQQGESLKLRIIALDREPVPSVTAHYRPMDRGDWRKLPAKHVARAAFAAVLPPAHEDFEYYITSANHLVWPATAPQISQTVIVTEIRNLRQMQP